MVYKNSKWIIKKEDLEDGKIITNNIVLRKHKKKVICGIVKNTKGELLKNCAVLLQTVSEENINISDMKITITDEDGKFIFSIYIEEKYHYKIKIYAPNNI